MAKIYERVRGDNGIYGWEDFPSNNTSVNAQRLNHMDVGIDENDTRISKIDEIKATKLEVAPLIKDIEFNDNGILTITRKNGDKFSFDTKMGKIAINFGYDPIEQEIVLDLNDGSKQYIDLSALISQYEFLNTGTVAFFIDELGAVYASVKEGSIEERHLRPDYLAEIKIEVSKSEAGARNSDIYAKLSQSYAVGGTNSRDGEDTDNSKYYYQQSKTIYDNFSQAGTVTGVKGNAEGSYRAGNVNLTAEDIGAYGKLNIGTEGYKYQTNCIMVSGVSLNEIDESGLYFCDAPLDAPVTTNGFMIAITYAGKIRGMQLFMPLGENQIYKRQNTNGTWGDWEKINAGRAESAIKATRDGNGDVIADTYAKKEWIFLGSAGKGGGAFRYDATINGGDEFLLVIYIAPINDDIGFFETHYIPYDVFTQTAAHTNGIVDYSIKIDNENVYNGSKVNVSFNRGYFIFTNNTGNCYMKIYAKK